MRLFRASVDGMRTQQTSKMNSLNAAVYDDSPRGHEIANKGHSSSGKTMAYACACIPAAASVRSVLIGERIRLLRQPQVIDRLHTAEVAPRGRRPQTPFAWLSSACHHDQRHLVLSIGRQRFPLFCDQPQRAIDHLLVVHSSIIRAPRLPFS